MKDNVVIRPATAADNKIIATIIRSVMPEFGASGAGFAIHDAEVDDMATAFGKSRCQYFVCVKDNAILGGGGIAPLSGGDYTMCELKKMYFLPDARGLGLGQRLLTECLRSAVKFGYTDCYLETFNTMQLAMKLYERNGFKKIAGPLGKTGHFACDAFYNLDLKEFASRDNL